MMFSHGCRHVLVMSEIATTTAMWFDIDLAQAFSGIWRTSDRNCPPTPCRLEVTERGLCLYRWPGGRMGKTVVSWKDLRCVRVTDSLVVVSPSARGKFHVDWLAAYPSTRFGDVDNCVMVARSALPDQDGFVKLCRMNIERALEDAEPPSRWRRMVYRLSVKRGEKY
ncbi:hypothetical protein OZX62_07450 [Bifidobacterium sp. ESL0690]|uniref:hypothetical protein n=1 Tax=Bifidobacterium sp. ESL0690 TaxID=2983214 RepID=UPI0023F809C8|nr:hypothetical protein [Bifidobacterium sp. ESL0690]WEV46273.1 hypothetical protein OZX62_07450 [Bifidobacterium sp. ESL0690]